LGEVNIDCYLRTRLAALAELSVGDDGDMLKNRDPDEDLESTAVGNCGVVGLERADTKNRVMEIGKDPARGGEHGNAAVLDLSFAEEEGPLRGLLGELQGIKVLELGALVTGESTSECHLHGAGSHTSWVFPLIYCKCRFIRDSISIVCYF
jgi:hypothetical protein